jgi:hypothetical protein
MDHISKPSLSRQWFAIPVSFFSLEIDRGTMPLILESKDGGAFWKKLLL